MDKNYEKHKKHLEDAVKNLAMQRAMLMKLDVMTEEEITGLINEFGEKYAKKYEKMGVLDIMLEAMVETLIEIKERSENDG